LEFFGDDVESIRQFSAQTQRSLKDLKEIAILAARNAELGARNSEPSEFRAPSPRSHMEASPIFLPADSWVILIEPDELREQGRLFLDRSPDLVGLFQVTAYSNGC